MMAVYKIIFLALIMNNVVLTRFIGVRPLADIKNTSYALKIGASLLIILLISNSISFILKDFVLEPLHLNFLLTFCYIITIISVILLLAFVFKRSGSKFFSHVHYDLPQITSNSIILGICLLMFENSAITNYFLLIVFTISSVAGYFLVAVIMGGIAEHIRLTGVSRGMKGIPILLITLGILALAFMGLAGIFK